MQKNYHYREIKVFLILLLIKSQDQKFSQLETFTHIFCILYPKNTSFWKYFFLLLSRFLNRDFLHPGLIFLLSPPANVSRADLTHGFMIQEALWEPGHDKLQIPKAGAQWFLHPASVTALHTLSIHLKKRFSFRIRPQPLTFQPKQLSSDHYLH